MYALIAKPGSPFRTVPCEDIPSLEWLQKQVGGYIETIPVCSSIGSNLIMVVDEEGKYKDYTLNLFATAAARLFGDFILGTAVILRADGEDLCGLDYTAAKAAMYKLNHATGRKRGDNP